MAKTTMTAAGDPAEVTAGRTEVKEVTDRTLPGLLTAEESPRNSFAISLPFGQASDYG